MSTIIQAGNATSGAVVSSDTAGSLQLQTGSTPTTAINIDAAQNVQLGSTTPASTGIPVTVAKAYNASTAPIGSAIALQRTDGTDVLGSIGFYNSAGTKRYAIETNVTVGNGMEFNYGASNKMYLDTSGNLLVGGTTVYGTTNTARGTSGYTYASISVSNQSEHFIFKNDATTVGSITRVGGTGVAYNTSSDYRLKENIAPITNALDKISQLKPCTYTWKLDGSKGQGFIAHELQEVIPEAVNGEKNAVEEDGTIKPQGIDQSKIVATLVAAIQELNAKVTALETQLGAK